VAEVGTIAETGSIAAENAAHVRGKAGCVSRVMAEIDNAVLTIAERQDQITGSTTTTPLIL
jgi:methyl-accepting chemotaxis protein